MPPLFGWLMAGEWELLCGVERFHHKNRKESPLQAAGAEQRESLNMPVQSAESPVESDWVQGSGDLLPDMHRLWCDCEKSWRPFSLQGRTGGDTGCPLRGPVGLLRCHLHTMWQTPLVWPFFTLPHPLPSTFLDIWVKTPARALPQARTETVWTPPVTASRSITSHLNPLRSPPSSSFLFFFSGSRLSLLILWLRDFYQGLAQTYATCHPAVRGHTAWSQM